MQIYIYIDNQLASDCNTYSVQDRDCTGDKEAYRTIAGATNAAQPGDTVYFREGNYSEELIPKQSGTAGSPITYRGYEEETATITGPSLSPAILLSGRSYLILESLKIDNVRRWLIAVDTHHTIIRDCEFSRALDTAHSQKTGLFFEKSTYNKILNNSFEDCNEDSIGLVESDYNLVEGNVLTKAYHTLWDIKCGNYNIFRNNYFHNKIEKIGEIFDCWGVGINRDIYILNSTKHNLIENNIFAYVPSSGDSSPYSGIQFAGQETIIRNNVFYETVGPGLSFALYHDESKHNLKNRVYHNVFHNTDFAGIEIAGPIYEFKDNIIKNNILSDSVFVANDKRWNWYNELEGKPIQVKTGRDDGYSFVNNCFSGDQPDDYYITFGMRTSNNNPVQHPLTWWEANHPELFSGNLQQDPRYIDADAYNFTLAKKSGLRDKGDFLTYTRASGTGTNVEVEDALYFSDGFGLIGTDVIQFEGDTERYEIINVDYRNNILIINESASYQDEQGVSLTFEGTAPDIGLYSPVSANVVANCPEISDVINIKDQWFVSLVSTKDLIDKIKEWKEC